MRYVGFSLKELLRLHIVTMGLVTRYFIRHILPNRIVLKNSSRLFGSKKGKSAFVFANGPSMNILDPNKIKEYCQKGYEVFAVNSYINSNFGAIVTPNYYVLSDPAHFGVSLNLLSDNRKKEVAEDLDKIKNLGVELFVPAQFYHRVAGINKYPFCDSENLFSKNVSDILKPRGYVSMTAYKALSIACYLGYDKIYICGFDNNYFKSLVVDSENNLYYMNEHFNECEKSLKVLHKIRKDEGENIGELLYNHHLLFKSLDKFCKESIINLDTNSLVDCFSKKHDLLVYCNDDIRERA